MIVCSEALICFFLSGKQRAGTIVVKRFADSRYPARDVVYGRCVTFPVQSCVAFCHRAPEVTRFQSVCRLQHSIMCICG